MSQLVYAVWNRFTPEGQHEAFAKLDEACDFASKLSRMIPGIRMDVRAFNNNELGTSLASFENGQLWVNYQLDLFGGEPSEAEKKFLKEVGRAWWTALGRLNESIYGYNERLTALTADERLALQTQKALLHTILGRLEREMKEEEFDAAKWKFVDSVVYKNRKVPLTGDVKYSHQSTVRKYYLEACLKTGTVAFKEGWPIPDDKTWGPVWQFFGGAEDSEPKQEAADNRVIKFLTKAPASARRVR